MRINNYCFHTPNCFVCWGIASFVYNRKLIMPLLLSSFKSSSYDLLVLESITYNYVVIQNYIMYNKVSLGF